LGFKGRVEDRNLSEVPIGFFVLAQVRTVAHVLVLMLMEEPATRAAVADAGLAATVMDLLQVRLSPPPVFPHRRLRIHGDKRRRVRVRIPP
jgi:hypothetical protein